MTADKLIILVTGEPASGKTDFLGRLEKTVRKWRRPCGFIAKGDGRGFRSGSPAPSYRLVMAGDKKELLWATRNKDGRGFCFHDETAKQATAIVRDELAKGDADICFMDEIGTLELKDRGFAELFRLALLSRRPVVAAAVKKKALADVMSVFGINAPFIIDLDHISAEQGLKEAVKRIEDCDAEHIGVFAGISGAVEVGLGSILHAYRVPLKGHMLAYLQNLMLITFGKSLNGRGLIRISFISAMLKAFSPMGNAFRPMIYIFLQGLVFASPIRFLGWNAAAVLLGSVLMGWFTLGVSLAVDYAIFGKSIFEAFFSAVAFMSNTIGVESPSLFQVICSIFILKALIALVLGTSAYYGNMLPLIHRLDRSRVLRVPLIAHADCMEKKVGRRLSRAAVFALRELVRPRFLIIFFLAALLLRFFTDLTQSDFILLIVRGLCISYLGFLAMRHIDIYAIGARLDKRFGMGLGKSLPAAFRMLGRLPVHQGADERGSSSPRPGNDPTMSDASAVHEQLNLRENGEGDVTLNVSPDSKTDGTVNPMVDRDPL